LTESHARELAAFPPEVQAKVVEDVGEDPTAARLREALEAATVKQIQHEEDQALRNRPEPCRRSRRDLADRMEYWAKSGAKLISRHYHDVADDALAMLETLMQKLRSSSEV
jgi:hypothetical protein